ncbi:MAG TPA: hypothetical protein PK649_09855 [Vicingus sp.]|nr:hypothetical protein [Flavobacteriales bacterium]MBV6486064.1 hypothetical protein [Flavobacteriales bacterium]HRN42361.1 hypothetical protein [Vicingus sp.]
MKSVKLFFIVFILFISYTFGQEKSNWSVEAHGGFPINIPLPLTIKQSGEPTIKLTAHFYSEPFVPPVYWVYRFSKWKNNKAWEFEMMHQKLYLKNTPPEVEYFSITHGFNLLMINRAYKFDLFKDKEFIFRIGGGIVYAHPENSIRGKELNQKQSYYNLGYYISGPTINIALAKQFPIYQRFYLNTEVKHNTSYAKVPVVDGHATVWHSAFEFIAGLGIYIIHKP